MLRQDRRLCLVLAGQAAQLCDELRLQWHDDPASDQRQLETTTVDGLLFTVAWDVSYVDLDPANPPAADLVGDLVKIKVEVSWMASGKRHQVTMTTFTTGRAP